MFLIYSLKICNFYFCSPNIRPNLCQVWKVTKIVVAQMAIMLHVKKKFGKVDNILRKLIYFWLAAFIGNPSVL